MSSSDLEPIVTFDTNIAIDNDFVDLFHNAITTKLFPTDKDNKQSGHYFLNNVNNWGDNTKIFIPVGDILNQFAIKLESNKDYDLAIANLSIKFDFHSDKIMSKLSQTMQASLKQLNWIGTHLYKSYYDPTRFCGFDSNKEPIKGCSTSMYVLKIKPIPDSVPICRTKKYISKTTHVVSQEERPSRIAQEERPSRIAQEERPSRITQQERPSRIAQEERPSRITQQERPSRIAQQVIPSSNGISPYRNALLSKPAVPTPQKKDEEDDEEDDDEDEEEKNEVVKVVEEKPVTTTKGYFKGKPRK
jgi:hypothetical protein